MKTKRDLSDAWFSRCVRERTGWVCERCHKQFPEGAQNLHASHFVSRRKRSTRWDPANVFAHCFSCHQYLGENPGEFYQWVQRFGRSVLHADDLVACGNETLKVTAKDRKEIAEHFKREYEKMKEKRANGERGRLEFDGWEG